MWRRLARYTVAACVVVACGHNVQSHRYEAPGEQLILPDEIAVRYGESGAEFVQIPDTPELGQRHRATGARAPHIIR